MDQVLVQYLEERFGHLDERFDEVKRHTGVLVEGLRHELRLVAEGLTMHIQDSMCKSGNITTGRIRKPAR